MAFTRESLAAYEAQTTAAAPAAAQTPPAEPAPVADAPVAAPDASDTSSVEDVSADPAVPGEDGTSDATDDSSSPPADSDSDTPTSEQGDGKPRKGSAQERIEELVFERNAARKFNDHLLDTIKELKAKVDGLAAPAPATASTPATATAPAASDDDPPTLEQYKFDPVEYAKAQSKWLKDQVDKKVATALAEAKGQQDIATAQQKFVEREAEAKKAYPDFEVVTSKNPNFPKLHAETANAIVRSDLGPIVAYEIGKDAVLSARIEKMNQRDQLAAIARVEGMIIGRQAAATKSTPKPAQKTVTKAPPPPTPVRGSSNPQKNVSEMSMEEFVAHDRQQKLAQQAELKQRRAMRR